MNVKNRSPRIEAGRDIHSIISRHVQSPSAINRRLKPIKVQGLFSPQHKTANQTPKLEKAFAVNIE